MSSAYCSEMNTTSVPGTRLRPKLPNKISSKNNFRSHLARPHIYSVGLDFLNCVSKELKSKLHCDHMSYMNMVEKQKKNQVWHHHSGLHCKAKDIAFLWFASKTAPDQYHCHDFEFCLCEQELNVQLPSQPKQIKVA